jgi:RNA polymerase sigma-70 factor (ECF subfamily)
VIDLDAWVPAIVAGDQVAFGRWVSGGEPGLRAGLRSFAAHVDTEAVLQEALLRIWQIAPRFEPDGRPNGLLRLGARIARNLALGELRRARVEPVEQEALIREADARSGELAEPDPLLRVLIARCREGLPPAPATALSSRLSSGGRSDRELASEAGMQLNTFLQNVRRARLSLVECLRRHGVVIAEVIP